MQLEKVFDGVKGNEEVYDLPFTKENLKELWEQRESDLIRLVVKDENGRAVEVRDVTSNPTRSFEIFRDSDFQYLMKGEYIPEPIKIEERQRAVAEGWIGGNISDYNSSANTGSNSKIYK